MEHKIELITGYTDKKGVTHREVVFGKRLTTLDLIALDTDPQAQDPTQYNDLIRRKMITKFGGLSVPVGLNVLLSLDMIDREDLDRAADAFMAESRDGRTGETRDGNIVKLRFGFDIDGTMYDIAQFGALTTGRDEVEANKLSLEGVGRECLMIGRQIIALRTEDGTVADLAGPVALKAFEKLDAEDLQLLRIGARFWRVSFRLQRTRVSDEPHSESGVSDDEGNGNDGGGSAKPADGAADDVSLDLEGAAR